MAHSLLCDTISTINEFLEERALDGDARERINGLDMSMLGCELGPLEVAVMMALVRAGRWRVVAKGEYLIL